jgi:signal transduction histidine kinase
MAVGLAVTAAALGWAGLVIALTLIPTPGVAAGPPGAPVEWVLPGSFAWHDGIRQAQTVVEIRHADTPDGWELITGEGQLSWGSAVAAHVAILRDLVPWAGLAAALGLLAIALAWTGRALAAPVAGIVAVLGTVAFLRLGEVALSTIGALVALAIPALSAALLLGRRRPPAAAAVGAGAVALAGAWLVSRAQGPVPFELAEPARAAGALAAIGLTVGAIVEPGTVRRTLLRVDPPRLVDALSLTVAAGIIVGAWFVGDAWFAGGASALLAFGVALVLVLMYPAWRRSAVRLVDGILVGQIRERASVAASEAERQRLARALHDEPLQQLSGLIRRLEARGAMDEADSVRAVMTELRAVTSELHPPVLVDLGLGPALESLVPPPTAGAPAVALAVEDRLEPSGERLPSEVEVAAYRIVQEAVRNAVRHAGARTITIQGRLEPGSLLLRVVDDGSGLDERRIRAAERSGHLGVGLMRQRAAAIGARLDICGKTGTAVTLAWAEADR